MSRSRNASWWQHGACRFNSNVSGFSAPVAANGFHGPASPMSSEVLGAPPRLADLSSSGLHHSEAAAAAPGRGVQWQSMHETDTGLGAREDLSTRFPSSL